MTDRLRSQPSSATEDAYGVTEFDRDFAARIIEDFGDFEEGITNHGKLAQWVRNIRWKVTNRFPDQSRSSPDIVAQAIWQAHKDNMHLRMVDVYPLMAAAAINAMRDAAAISQEPVAWRTKNDAGHWHVTADRAGAETWVWEKFDVEPLYGAHAQRADTSADVSTTKGSE